MCTFGGGGWNEMAHAGRGVGRYARADAFVPSTGPGAVDGGSVVHGRTSRTIRLLASRDATGGGVGEPTACRRSPLLVGKSLFREERDDG